MSTQQMNIRLMFQGGVFICGAIYLGVQNNAFTHSSSPNASSITTLLNFGGYQNHVSRESRIASSSSRPKIIGVPCLLGLSLSLLLDVVLGTALLGLAGVVLLLVLGLGARVTRDAGDGAAHGAGDAVCDARAEVRELALGLLLLALEVLLAALGLQRLLLGVMLVS